MKQFLFYLTFGVVALQSCHKAPQTTALSPADSLAGSYTAFKDSIRSSWNTMISDDNEKITAMLNLLKELKLDTNADRELLDRYGDQLNQLKRLRYTEKSMSNADVVEEYDFASTALVMEIISMAESRIDYPENILLQKLVDDILLADDRVNNYRADYDDIVAHYNEFIDINQSTFQTMDADSLKKKSLFQMVSFN